jgi:hypothetical protein
MRVRLWIDFQDGSLTLGLITVMMDSNSNPEIQVFLEVVRYMVLGELPDS